MLFRQLFDSTSSTYTYLLADPETREAILIDPVLEQATRDATLIEELGLKLTWILETHVHADHVTGASELRRALGAKVALSERSGATGADRYLKDGDEIRAGKVVLEARATPGHTNSCTTYVTADRKMAFTGDTLLIRGCGRTDFQEGDARTLHASVHEKLFTLPDHTLIYPAHDYKGRTVSSVGEEKVHNPRLGGGRSAAELVEIMSALDLSYPKQIDRALPLNLRLGEQEKHAALPHDAPWAPIARTPTGVPEVTVGWVYAQLSSGEFSVVDVRDPSELSGDLGRIRGVQSVPLTHLSEVAQDWARDRRLVVACRSGGRSGQGALQLEKLGFAHVASMKGGMLAWASVGLPVVRA